MAPIRPRSASSARAPSKHARTYPAPSETFSTSKKDKRTIKHSLLLSKIEKRKSIPRKKRRPGKKLIATLSELADALPDAEDKNGDDAEGVTTVGQAKIRHKSLKSRPGAMRKKEKLEKVERERFGKNMAQLANSSPASQPNGAAANEGDTAASSISQRWAALRSFIGNTMEMKEEFRNG